MNLLERATEALLDDIEQAPTPVAELTARATVRRRRHLLTVAGTAVAVLLVLVLGGFGLGRARTSDEQTVTVGPPSSAPTGAMPAGRDLGAGPIMVRVGSAGIAPADAEQIVRQRLAQFGAQVDGPFIAVGPDDKIVEVRGITPDEATRLLTSKGQLDVTTSLHALSSAECGVTMATPLGWFTFRGVGWPENRSVGCGLGGIGLQHANGTGTGGSAPAMVSATAGPNGRTWRVTVELSPAARRALGQVDACAAPGSNGPEGSIPTPPCNLNAPIMGVALDESLVTLTDLNVWSVAGFSVPAPALEGTRAGFDLTGMSESDARVFAALVQHPSPVAFTVTVTVPEDLAPAPAPATTPAPAPAPAPASAPAPGSTATTSRNAPGPSTAPGPAPIVPMDGFPSTPAEWDRYAFQHHPDRDFVVTFAAYEAEVTKTVECLRREGLVVTDPKLNPGGRFLSYTYAGDAKADVDGLARSCRTALDDLERLWTNLTALSAEDRAALEARVAQCIAEKEAQSPTPGIGAEDPEYACKMGGAQDALSGAAP